MTDFLIKNLDSLQKNQPINTGGIDSARISSTEQSVTIASTILVKNDSQLLLSIPQQSPLRIDLDKDANIAIPFTIGAKVNITLVKDTSHVIINMTAQTASPDILLSLPVTQSLLRVLQQNTSLPSDDALIKSHLANNPPILLGQVRQLPHEHITLRVNDAIVITEQFPGIKSLPMHETLRAQLRLNDAQQLTIDFSPRSKPPLNCQLMIPTAQLAETNHHTVLNSLPISQVSKVTPSSTSEAPLINLATKLDPTNPINQLWLRQQPISSILLQLSKSLDEIKPLPIEPLRPLAMNTKQPLASANKLSAEPVPQPPLNAPPQLNPQAQLHTQAQANQQTQLNTQAQANPQAQLHTQAQANPQAQLHTQAQANPQAQLHTQAQLNVQSPAHVIISPPSTEPLHIIPWRLAPLATPDIFNTRSMIVQDALHKLPLMPPLTPQVNSAPESLPAASTSAIASKDSQHNIAPSTPQQTATLALKKFHALVNTLHFHSSPQPLVEPAATTKGNTTDAPLNLTQDKLDASSYVRAIEPLKILTQRIQHQLPTMQQLTTATELSHLVEQFMRYEPLAKHSISLSSLGPLASALQLILGSRHVANGHSLSPSLLKQLSQLVSNHSKQQQPNILAALSMLGQSSLLAPLEEGLLNLSSNIQLYQYQNIEQQQSQSSLFYFMLPSKESQLPYVEGEVEQHSEQTATSEKSWRLTLLLPCSGNEKIHANALISPNKVVLELTCNNASLLTRAEFYQDFLANRLESLGFKHLKIHCQQGEIPTTLLKRPNQLVELMV